LILIAACGNDSTGIEGQWELLSGTVDSVEILPAAVPSPGDMAGSIRPVVLMIDGEEATGRGPCNRYGGPIEISEQTGWRSARFEFRVAFGEGFAELVGCREDETRIERKYLAALFITTHGQRSGKALTLYGPGVRLEFRRVGTG
jgi:hypothetical protein